MHSFRFSCLPSSMDDVKGRPLNAEVTEERTQSPGCSLGDRGVYTPNVQVPPSARVLLWHLALLGAQGRGQRSPAGTRCLQNRGSEQAPPTHRARPRRPRRAPSCPIRPHQLRHLDGLSADALAVLPGKHSHGQPGPQAASGFPGSASRFVFIKSLLKYLNFI